MQKAKRAPRNLSVVVGQSREVLKQGDAAWVASGTATIEAALLGCPTVLVYRGSFANYLLVYKLIRVPWFGIANIVCNREIMPERLQKDMAPIKPVAVIEPIIDDTPVRAAMIENFKTLEKLLGNRAPAGRVPQMICDETAV